MSDGEKSTRERLATVIQDTIQSDQSATDAGIDGSVLVGWVVVAEWATPDDGHAITCRTGAAADRDIAAWRAQGLLQYAADYMVVDE